MLSRTSRSILGIPPRLPKLSSDRLSNQSRFYQPQCRSSHLQARPTSSLFRPLSSPLPSKPLPILRQCRFYNDDFRSRFQQEVRSGGLRRNKLAFTVFSVLIFTAIGAATYYIYQYNKLVGEPLSAYPPKAAQEVKTALYYATKNDVPKMAQHFKAAIQEAEEAGLHPLSDLVAGLKMECSNMLWKMNEGAYRDKAVDVMEKTLDESAAGAEFFGKQNRWDERNRVLKRAVLLGYKVGEMYTDLGRQKSAEEAMVWSTETLLREGIRRHNVKAKPEEQGEWFSQSEVADFLEKLATHYESTNKFELAAPLYLRSLTMHQTPSCHSATLMTNLAAALSQQSPPENTKPKITKEDMVKQSQQWAQKAIEIAQKIQPPERTEECDMTCVVATYNLGEMAEMMSDKKTAIQKYQEALSLAKGLGMDESVMKCQEALKRAEAMKDKGWFGK